ncbi:MAG TPA: 30S ribosomal protein S6 [Candidatus Moranbacteria bacterium]|nr:30S ribosomal protein S6 [Candidatus Moranbacteria bacterium]
MKYELFYLVAGSRETELEAIKAATEEIITTEGGAFEEKEVVERRKLAYEIKHETHGFYVARRFEIEDTQKIQSITRKLNLHTGILRSIISNASELPELKTKEERIGAAFNRPERKTQEASEKSAPSKSEEKTPKSIEKSIPAEKKETEDIDKKLEEILNI